MSKHTPTPWEVVYVGHIAIGVGERLTKRGKPTSCFRMIGNTPAEGDSESAVAVSNANAEFVARAVNSHAELLAALRDCVTEAGAMAWDDPELAYRRLRAINSTAREAIAKAKGTA
jgi:hypothetical protein